MHKQFRCPSLTPPPSSSSSSLPLPFYLLSSYLLKVITRSGVLLFVSIFYSFVRVLLLCAMGRRGRGGRGRGRGGKREFNKGDGTDGGSNVWKHEPWAPLNPHNDLFDEYYKVHNPQPSHTTQDTLQYNIICNNIISWNLRLYTFNEELRRFCLLFTY